MAALRCCSFNCRGWNSGSVFLKEYLDSFDLCFVQEHWLHSDHLDKINSNFLSVSVSGMDSGSLLCGRPYGGCTILYRKSFAPCITPILSCSQCFCGVKVLHSSGLSHLLISLYMPADVIRLLLIHLESYKGSWNLNNVMLIFWLVISILIVAAL